MLRRILNTALVTLAALTIAPACGGGDGGGGPTAREWTVMVYLAADNNLATAGIGDIDEMEAAGADARVQVVVQAEFSPDHLAQVGCNASCFNRPNFNTFRYAISGQGASVPGPNGAVLDIGSRNMSDPAQLREFIQWAKQNYPARRYALVLWNHGGGYTGLIEDASAGDFMSIGELPAALNGVGAIDVLDFDMCLMAGYETLVMVGTSASYVVFSEEVVPGAGNPYTQIIDAIQANPTAPTRDVATAFVDQFHASYAGDNASTTKSAYEAAGFAAFEVALNLLADSLRTNLGSIGGSVSAAAAASQKYSYTELTDIVSLLDSLRVRTSSPTLRAGIDAVRAQATGTLRVQSRARNGTGVSLGGPSDVTRSTGLNIALPSGTGEDRFADEGPRSFAAYQALYATKPWTQFLASYVAGQTSSDYADQGVNRFEGYLVWQSGAVAAGADVDMWILEPNGDLFIPYLGSVTPNGVLTNDSYDDETYYEGYLTNRFIQKGTYKFYANLWIDPSNFRPLYDIAYRSHPDSPFVSLYDPSFPQLSTAVSWLSDPSPTFGEVEGGAYTDLQYVAFLPVPLAAARAPERTPSGALRHPTTSEAEPAITAAQFQAARQAILSRDERAASTRVPRALSHGIRLSRVVEAP